ncbi:AAA family ATPase [Blastococcus brunescens]|uniref:AAA family ATPase n=1 Tax=Blastococcus brunescens TaxID=1564165 RepID=A0ABZ1B8C9_9ACTN|nr:AAA family ATPase [Blastococcus sp. BMG 8361]WRL67057.1 AAA family ATPase [Blastococcus sp. BMG 8361]
MDVRRSAGGQRASRGTIGTLPGEVTSFVGRQADLRGVAAALAENRVVVLTGVGGVGKSRLARHVARELAEDYADGVVLCDLVGADDSSGVPDVVATALGVLPSERGAIDGLSEVLRAQQVLLVVDNCEHVLAGASGLVNRLRDRCPDVRVLATSRQPLDVSGQQVWPVAPLDVVEEGPGTAVQLFRERAASADPTVVWTPEDREDVLEVCRRLDGLPLAIELAAARTRSMTPADIAERLDSRLDVLTEHSGSAPPRHRSLQAALDWSYELLPVMTQRLFDRLAVFAGGFDLDAAVRVCAGDGVPAGAVAGRLAELVDHSLVAVDRSDRHARYRLLESLQAYAEAHLEERGELRSWRRRHAEHYLSLVEHVADGLRGPDEAQWVHLVDTELANVRAAQNRACVSGRLEVALRLPGLLCDYAYYRLRDEVYGWAERALELPGASAHPARPAALLTAAVGRMQRGELDRALEDGARVLAATSDDRLVLRATQLSAEIALYQGRLDDVDRRGEEVLERARAAGIPTSRRWATSTACTRPPTAGSRSRRGHVSTPVGGPWREPAPRACGRDSATSRGDPAGRRARGGARRLLPGHRGHPPGGQPVRGRGGTGVGRLAGGAAREAGRGAARLPRDRPLLADERRLGPSVDHAAQPRGPVRARRRRRGRRGPARRGAHRHHRRRALRRGRRPSARRSRRAAAVIGEEAFAAAETRGRCMSDVDVVTFVVDEIERLLAARPAEGRG